jgi:hypothetical protein
MTLDEKTSNTSEKDTKEPAAQVSSKRVDEAAILVGTSDELDPAEAKRVRQKIDRLVLPMMCGMSKDRTVN